MNKIIKHNLWLTVYLSLLLPVLAAAQQAKLISINMAGTMGVGGFQSVDRVPASADGRYVLFASIATGITQESDTNGNIDVFLRDTITNTTRLVSASTAGNSTGNNLSEPGSISADGRYVAFSSTATDLVAQTVPAGGAAYVRDMQTNMTRVISLNAVGGVGHGDLPFISANGQFVVFRSFNQLMPPDNNVFWDVYIHNLQAGTTRLVSINAAGNGTGDNNALSAQSQRVVSDDGRYVVFQSIATNFSTIPNTGALRSQVHVRDMQLGVNIPVSLNPDQTVFGNNHSEAPNISANGRYVSFQSAASNIVAGDTNNASDVFQRDLQTGITARVSFNSGGTGGTFSSGGARMTPDGRYTAFVSSASLLPNDTQPGTTDVYVYDRQTATNRLVSVNLNGIGGGGSGAATISDDGRFVAFPSSGGTFAAFDIQTGTGVYVRDLQTGRTSLLSRNQFSAVRNADTTQFVTISSDGKSVAFAKSGTSSIVPQPIGVGGFQIYQTRVSFLAGNDFSGDGRAELAVFRPSDGNWYTQNLVNSTFTTTKWGQSGDRITPGDYDGDRKFDFAVFRSGIWYILRSSDNSFSTTFFGLTGDATVPGDYDGDGATDIAVFRDGIWYYLESGTGSQPRAFNWGITGDLPVPGDYDRDATTDFAVFRGGTWFIRDSNTGAFRAVNFGLGADKPVQADYDGDLRTDIAVFRNGTWFFILSTTGQFRATQWGLSSDLPVPSNYFGIPSDAASKLGVYRNGTWFLVSLQNNSMQTHQFGLAGDIPIPNANVP